LSSSLYALRASKNFLTEKAKKSLLCNLPFTFSLCQPNMVRCK
jgi:hypothetical protein